MLAFGWSKPLRRKLKSGFWKAVKSTFVSLIARLKNQRSSIYLYLRKTLCLQYRRRTALQKGKALALWGSSRIFHQSESRVQLSRYYRWILSKSGVYAKYCVWRWWTCGDRRVGSRRSRNCFFTGGRKKWRFFTSFSGYCRSCLSVDPVFGLAWKALPVAGGTQVPRICHRSLWEKAKFTMIFSSSAFAEIYWHSRGTVKNEVVPKINFGTISETKKDGSRKKTEPCDQVSLNSLVFGVHGGFSCGTLFV